MTTGTRQSTLRPPPSSPSLAALLEVESPSPILSPSDLSSFHSSGEIPILLFDSSHAVAVPPEERDQSLFSIPIPHPRTCGLPSKLNNPHVVDLDSDGFPNSSTGISLKHMVKTNLVFDSLGCHTLKSEESRLPLCWSSSLSTGDFTRDGINAAEHDIELYNDSWLGAHSRKPSDAEKFPSLRLEHGNYFDTEETLYIQDSRSVDTPLVDSDLVVYASPPASSSNLNHHKRGHSVPTARDHLIFGPSSAEITLIDPCVEVCSIQGIVALSSISSLSKKPAMHITCPSSTTRRESDTLSQSQIIPRKQGAGRVPRGSANNASPETDVPPLSKKHSLSLSSHVPHHLTFPVPRSPPSPPRKTTATPHSSPRCNYPWLQNIIIGLVIDQEGFRSIEPMFEMIGIRRVHLESGTKELDVAMFVPTMKQAYRFHYAPFEGLPILRRLTVNGDESRDFLSRQAYLGLKSNGVYIVHGTEVASPTAVLSGPPMSVDNGPEMAHTSGRIQGQPKLYWWFEYSIEDCKADQPGRNVDGERVLIPLTFGCSPGLIHPSQGKKIKLMHIVRKSVTPKLVAERKQQSFHYPEAKTSAPPLLGSRFTPKMGLESQFISPSSANNQAYKLHRRSHSNPREHKVLDVRTKTFQGNDPKGGPSDSPEIDVDSRSTHRRRASSAEAYPRLRHIMPPSRLRQLLEESRIDYGTRDNGSHNKAASSPPLDFSPLKPSPRFRVHQ